jgi:hypothetical protein
MTNNKLWSPEQILDMLHKSPVAVERGLLAIYARQTADERASESTNHKNNVGFNGFDAPLLSSMAQQLKEGRRLSRKQMDIVSKRICKYAKQLAAIANENTTGATN